MIKRLNNLIASYFQSGIPFFAFCSIKMNRNSKGSIKLKGVTFNYSNGNVFIELYKHLFVEEVYNFFPEKNGTVTIIDAGANIGMATLYFKNKFPDSKVLIFEPGKNECETLKKNIAANNLENTIVYNSAIWINNDGISFSDTSDMGSKIDPMGKTNLVPTRRLKEIIEQETHINFLKLDIEGAELEVLKDCKEVLHRIDKMFIEYHSAPQAPQQLNELLTLLTSCGFRYYIKEDCLVTDKPFSNFKPIWGYDLQLQVFAFKGK